MASEKIMLHHKTPEVNKVEKIANRIKDGAVILYPTDTGFALGCALSNKAGITKIRQLRKLKENKSLTFLCDSLSHISEFAKVDNQAYRFIKSLIPGTYTFILPASKEVPNFAQDPKRNTAGIRVPDYAITKSIIKEVGQPIISISAKIDDSDSHSHEEIFDFFANQVDIAIEAEEYNFTKQDSTVIDLTKDESFEIIREGAGYEEVMKFM